MPSAILDEMFEPRIYVDGKGREMRVLGLSGNERLENAAVDMFQMEDPYFQDVIDSLNSLPLGDRRGWEQMPGKAYKKKGIGRIYVAGLDAEPISLQLAKCYVDPDIDVPGVPFHNHPDESEIFGYPRGQGRLIVGLEECSVGEDRKEIAVGKDVFTFIHRSVYYSLESMDPKRSVYVAVMRFDPGLIERFGKGNSLVIKELID